MNHDTILKGLNKLSKTLPTDIDPKQHVRHIASENDRGFMILHGSTIDDMLAMYLKGNFKGLNSDEKARVFEYAGAAGTFSSRLFLAQAVGIITRVTRKRCEVIKAIRNTAAHSHEQISFSTPEIQNAVTHFFPFNLHTEMQAWEPLDYRMVYGLLCVLILRSMRSSETDEIDFKKIVDQVADKLVKRKASRQKPT